MNKPRKAYEIPQKISIIAKKICQIARIHKKKASDATLHLKSMF